MSSALFVQTLAKMKAHRASGATTRFPVERHFPMAAARPMALAVTSNDDATAAVNQLRESARADLKASGAAQQQGVSDAATALHANQTEAGISDFKAKMEAQRQKAIADSTATINRAYDKAEELGKDAPAPVQALILQGMETVQNFVQDVMNKIVDIISDLIGKVVGWIKDVLGNVLSSIGGAFSSVLSAI